MKRKLPMIVLVAVVLLIPLLGSAMLDRETMDPALNKPLAYPC